jgi:hypothetical protein
MTDEIINEEEFEESAEESNSLFQMLGNQIAEEQIPEIFFSFDTGEAFEECSVCGKKLKDTDNDYMIEKAIKNYPGGTTDIIFEYACCKDCYLEMSGKISKGSRTAIEEIADKYSMNLMINLGMPGPDEPDKCCYSNKPVADCSEYQIFGIFNGNYRYGIINTCAVSDDVIEEMQEALSEETREELDDFTKQVTPDFPVGEEYFKFKPIIL